VCHASLTPKSGGAAILAPQETEIQNLEISTGFNLGMIPK